MQRTLYFRIGCVLATIFACSFAWAQTKAPKTVRRAQPPKFEKPGQNFFADAFKEGLQGERPGNLGQAVVALPPMPGGNATSSSAPAATGGLAGSGWATIISGGTLEDMIKSMKLQVDQEVTTPSDFAGKGYKLARRDFSMLAMTFGIIGEYDGDVRWKANAPAARDEFARTAANSKVGTTGVFNEAKKRKEELQDLVGGSNPFEGKSADAKAAWKDVCNRTPLMQHLENVWEPRLKPACSDKGQFTANQEKVLQDAEIFAAIATVLAKEGMEDADAKEYTDICNKLKNAALEIVDAVKSKNFDKASKAATEIGKSCVECHENYRS